MKLAGVERGDRSPTRRQKLEDLGVKLYPDLDSMLPECDVVTIHVPSTADTRGMVNRSFLGSMKDGACLVNTSRGDVVVAEELLETLEERDLWVALDVFPDEPAAGEAEYNSALAKHPRVYGTHHIGASTEQAQEAIARQVIKVIDHYCDGAVRNTVNLAEPMAHTTVIGIRHVDQVGVLSRVFSVLRGADINVEHMENHIFQGAHAAKAVMHVHGDFNDAVRKELADLEAVFDVAVLREESS
jgi:D-3-phosphoglycerate dehydrogenase